MEDDAEWLEGPATAGTGSKSSARLGVAGGQWEIFDSDDGAFIVDLIPQLAAYSRRSIRRTGGDLVGNALDGDRWIIHWTQGINSPIQRPADLHPM